MGLDYKALIRELATIEHEFEQKPDYPAEIMAKKFAKLRNTLRKLDGMPEDEAPTEG